MIKQRQQCKAFIIAKKRRCLKLEISSSDYCEFHGPLCQALTNVGMPCNSMVLNFRKGYIYCENHTNVGIERHLGILEEPSYSYNRSEYNNNKSNNEYPGKTIIKQTTTTISTSNVDHLCKIIELLDISKKS
jgi:hypothetical protein